MGCRGDSLLHCGPPRAAEGTACSTVDLAGEDVVPSLQEVGSAMDLDLKFTPLDRGQRTRHSVVLGTSPLILLDGDSLGLRQLLFIP